MADRLLEIVMEQSNQGIAVVNNIGVVIDHNKKWQNIFKHLKPINGMSLNDILPGLKINPNEQSTYESKAIKKSVEISFQQINLEADEYYRIYFVAEAAEQAVSSQQYKTIKEQKEIYEMILNAIDEGVFLMDRDGYIKFLNPAAEKLEGYEASDVLNKHISEVYVYDKELSTQMEVVKHEKSILNVHLTYPTPKKIVDVMANFYPIYSNSKISGTVCIYQDFEQYYKLITKNVDLQKQLNRSFSAATGKKSHQNRTDYSFDQLIGESTSLQMAIEKARLAAKTDSPVLIYGETGTGKELFAQSIHASSPRAKGPFVAINCAAIPENLLEGILFGTSKGAFTDARDKAGLFEQTNGGSIYLDEINSMPLSLQAKLLRVIQEKKVRRLGSNHEKRIDVRIISSCNVEPNQAKRSQQIRDDLFYRLAVVYLVIPPLRNRENDVLILSEYFIEKFRKQFFKHVTKLHQDVFVAFQHYEWPGNVRQLQHCLESAMNIVPIESSIIEPKDIPEYLGLFNNQNSERTTLEAKSIISESNITEQSDFAEKSNIPINIKEKEKKLIRAKLAFYKGNITKTATDLGISRQRLQYRLKKYGLQNLPSVLKYAQLENSNDKLVK